LTLNINNYHYFTIKLKIIFIIFKTNYELGIGDGDWGLGIGDWGLGPIPNPQSPIPIYNYYY